MDSCEPTAESSAEGGTVAGGDWLKFAGVAVLAAGGGFLIADRIRLSRELEAEKSRLIQVAGGPTPASPAPGPTSAAAPSAPRVLAPEPPDPLPAISPDVARQMFGELAAKAPASFFGSDWEILRRGFRAWGADGTTWLAEILTRGKSQDRWFASALLAGLARSRPESLPLLATALAEDGDPLVRRTISTSFATDLLCSAVRPSLEKAFGDSDPGVRVNAAYGLARLGRRDVLSELVRSAEDPAMSPVIRTSAFEALVDVGEPSTAAMFRRRLREDEEPSMFLASCRALRKMRDRESLPDLTRFIDDCRTDWMAREARFTRDAIAGQ